MNMLARHIISIIIVFFCVNLFAVASANPSKLGTKDNFIMYENKNYNFQINYPVTWKITEDFMGSIVVFLSPIENVNDKFSENINVIVQDLTAYPDLTLNNYEELNVTLLQQVITDYKFVRRGNIIISGFPAKIAVFTGRQGLFNLKYMQVYMIANNIAYVITFTAEDTQYRHYEEIAKEIVNSILIK